MNDYALTEAEAQEIKNERLAGYRRAIYERELNIAMFDALGKTDRVDQEQAEINDLKTSFDAIAALE